MNSNADNFAKCGGNFNDTSYAGVWNRNVNYNLSNSNNNVGFSDSIRNRLKHFVAEERLLCNEG